MNIFSGLFKSRDKPTNSTNGSAYRFFWAIIHKDKRITFKFYNGAEITVEE